jgi:hypothetical protein
MTPDRKAFEDKITNALIRVARESRGEEEESEDMHAGADVVVMQQPGLTAGTLFKWLGLLGAIFGAGYLLRGWGEASNGSANLMSYFKRPREDAPPPLPTTYSQIPYPTSLQVTTTLPDGRTVSAPTLGEASHALALLAKENGR